MRDEFVAIPIPSHQQRHVITHPIESGLSEWLTAALSLFDVENVEYVTYVDGTGHQLVPMLVVIITGSRLGGGEEEVHDGATPALELSASPPD